MNKETVFDTKYLKFIDYLFDGLSPPSIKKIFHKSIVMYIAKYEGYCIGRGLDEEGHVKWRINYDAE